MPRIVYSRLYWTLVASFCALGVCIAFVQPVYSAPDESTHWTAAHARVDHLVGGEGCVPTFLPPRNRRKHQPVPQFETLRSTPLKCVPEDTSLYGDVLTYPAALISHLLVRDPNADAESQLRAIFVTRMVQGAMVALCLLRLGSLALRSRPGGALTAAAFAVSPIFAQQSFAVSSDGAQLCFGLALFAVVKYWDELRWPDIAAFAVFGWGAAAKPFVLLLLLPSVLAGFWFAALREDPSLGLRTMLARIWAALKPTTRPSRATVLLWLSVFLSLATVVMAMKTASGGDATAPQVTSGYSGVDPAAQLELLEREPVRITRIAFRQEPWPWRFESYVGPMGWLDAHASKGTVRAFVRLMRLAIAFELIYALWMHRLVLRARLRELGRRLRSSLLPFTISMLGPLLNTFLIAITLYLSFTKVGRGTPAGIQARYYIPSMYVVIAACAATFELLLGDRESPAQPHAEQRGWVGALPAPVVSAGRALYAALPVLLLGVTIPLIVRVFLDLSKRYN